MAVLCPDVFASYPSSNPYNFTSSNSNSTYISWAENICAVLGAYDASGKPYITKTGIATPAVDPLNWHDTTPYTSGSPEGQNFVVLIYAAWRDCVYAQVCGNPLGRWLLLVLLIRVGRRRRDLRRLGERRRRGIHEGWQRWWAEESFGYIWQDIGVNSFWWD